MRGRDIARPALLIRLSRSRVVRLAAAIPFLAGLLVWPAVAAGPGARQPRTSSLVVDGAGRPVGIPLGGAQLFYATVGIRAGGAMRLVYLGREGFVGSTAQIVFESGGCLGEPLLLAMMSTAPTFFAEAALGPGNVLYGPTGTPVSRMIRSTWVPEFSPACKTVSATAIDAYAVVPLLDLDQFTPPFRLE